MAHHPSSAYRLSRPAVVLAALLTVLLTVSTVGTTSAPAATQDAVGTSAADSRTWVVDAVDDAQGARWVAEDTGTSEVTIQVGDTVEWQFDVAVIDHDLTSRDTHSTWGLPVAEYRVPQGPPVRYTFTQPGVYDYLCSIHGVTMSGTVVVEEVGEANQPPTADPSVEPTSGPAPLDVHFTANATDPDSDPLTYRWDFGITDGSSDQSPSAHSMHRYTTPGLYTASLEVSDGRGGLYTEEFAITVGGSDAPLVSAAAAPTTGPAPLDVTFTGTAEDEQGGDLTYAWDFGVDGTDDDTATGPGAGYTYDVPGTYTATLSVTDGDGNTGTDTIQVVATGGGVQSLPRIMATAALSSGAAPLDVAFSTEVTTAGEVRPFADGVASYPGLVGTAEMVRSRGETYASIEVTGLKPSADHLVHAHEQSCSSGNGGAHFRFDETRPFSAENEIWLYFTSDAQGRSNLIEVTQPQRAGPKAVAIVIHDPDNPARRIGCVDLAPSTADLAYAWDFGDGTTGEGSDPGHRYTAAGTYNATVTVGSVHAGHGAGHGATVTDSVEVVVTDTEAPQTQITSGPDGTVRSRRATFGFTSNETASSFTCRLDDRTWEACVSGMAFRKLPEGRHLLHVRATDAAGNTDATPATHLWTVDTTGPAIRGTGPSGPTRDRTPTVRAVVKDRHSAVRRNRLVLRIDGRRVDSRGRYDARSDQLTWTPSRALSPGRHTMRLTALDAMGNRTVRTWQLTIRR